MITPKKEKLIVKFLTNQASADELDELENWILDSNNEEIFNTYVKTNYLIEYNLKKFDANKVKSKLLKVMASDKKAIRLKKSLLLIRYAAAIVLIGFLATSYFFKDNLFNKQKNSTPRIVNSKIQAGTDKATLTLENGLVVALEKGKNFQTKNANSNGEEIIYDADESNLKEIAFNYLTIPRGGQFYIKLSDGTQVWLNSESQLKYPVSFREGEIRKVELVYGEAYFDVSPSIDHKGTSFRVYNNKHEVRVLGTKFNIKAYKDETNIYTTLVEGKVVVSFDELKQNLVPNQQSNFNINNNKLTISNVDVYNETSWKEGVFSFDGKTLKDIMKVLSRWYDMEVVYKNKMLEDEEFIGVLGKDQNIEDILSSIKNFGIIKDYEIKDMKVVLE